MIENICILGGGTAGFMTAAVLSKLGVKVKCIFSSKIGTIGVGESTQTPIRNIFTFLGIKDEEWMPKCNATYKTNISFESWSKDGEKFFYPFELGKLDKETVNNFFELNALFPTEVKSNMFARYVSPSSRYAELNRLSKEGWDFKKNTAFHFDTHLLSKLLYKYCKRNGVEFVDDEYLSCEQNKDGIEYLSCEKTGNHRADLFIDCSGFKSLLLGKEMGVSFKKYETQINNRVLRCKVPYKNKNSQIKNYTNNVALDNGWCWEIPLWDGMSLGYVHTLQFADENSIEQEFINFVRERYGVDPEINAINFKSGRHENAWVKNVASVGLSYGFIEPLESTGLVSVVTNIFRLLEVITQSQRINSFDRKLFNYTVNLELDKQKNFVDIHYQSAHKNDTDYWKYVTNHLEYDWESENHKLSIEMTMFNKDYANHHLKGLPFILSGNGYSPLSPGLIRGSKYDMNGMSEIKDKFLSKDKDMNEKIMKSPSTMEFLKSTIYKNFWDPFI